MTDVETYLEGEGAWWSYYVVYPFEGNLQYPLRKHYRSTAFERAQTLYGHLLSYGLAKKLGAKEPIQPGDLIFWDEEGTSLEQSHIDHVQVVSRKTHRGEPRSCAHGAARRKCNHYYLPSARTVRRTA